VSGTTRPNADTARWKAAASELSAEKSLARLVSNARNVVATVSAVATALAALGLVAVDELRGSQLILLLAVVTLILVIFAVGLASVSLVLRTREVNPENLVEVEAWYRSQFRRGGFVTAAGVALLLGIAATGATGLAVLLTSPGSEPQLFVSVSGNGGGQSVALSAEAENLRAGSSTLIILTALEGDREVVLFESAGIVGSDGVLSVDTVVSVSPTHRCFTAVADVAGQSSEASLRCG
jgi:hypothetical protein